MYQLKDKMVKSMENEIGKPNSNSSWDSLCSFCSNILKKGMKPPLPRDKIRDYSQICLYANVPNINALYFYKAVHPGLGATWGRSLQCKQHNLCGDGGEDNSLGQVKILTIWEA